MDTVTHLAMSAADGDGAGEGVDARAAAARAGHVREAIAFREAVERRRAKARGEQARPTAPIKPEKAERLRDVVLDRFSTDLFHRVGMRALAKEAGLGVATIYKVHPSKERLLLDHIDPALDRITRALALEARKAVGAKAMVRAVLSAREAAFDADRRTARILLQTTPAALWPGFVAGWRCDQMAILADALRQGVRERSVRPDAPADELAAGLASTSSARTIGRLSAPEGGVSFDLWFSGAWLAIEA